MDQSKKTMRHFYCRDVLWETFEQMANDFDCSIDYLINEAMRFYARSKNYQSPGGAAVAGQQPVGGPAAAGQLERPERRSAAAERRSQPRAPTSQPVAAGRDAPATAWRRRRCAPSRAADARLRAAAHARPVGRAADRSLAARTRPRRRSRASRPMPHDGRGRPDAVPGVQQPALSRSTRTSSSSGAASKTSDLAIKDGNISRKHAAVIRRNGMFYIKDLGSTNGIDYKGMRIDNKRIDEGDVFHICDYELRFTYRTD